MAQINRVNFRDIQALNGLRVCGYGKREDLLKIITSNRIDKMIKQGILESKVNVKNEVIYTYTDKGKSFIKNLDSLKDKAFYSRQTASSDHDTRLFREYTQLTPNERMSCMSETQTRDLYAETIKQDQANAELEKMLSVPDITYTTETGEAVAIEVITENYNEQRIEMKVNYCQTVNIELRTVRVWKRRKYNKTY